MMQRPVLIIDHPVDGGPSFFLPDIRRYVNQWPYTPIVRDYTELSDVDPREFAAVVSASGFCRIRGEEAQSRLARENEITDICEEEGIPLLCITHGAQIRAVHIYGDDALERAAEERKGEYNDYAATEAAGEDVLFCYCGIKPVKSGDLHVYPDYPYMRLLRAREHHAYDIDLDKLDKGRQAHYISLLLDSNRKTIVARHMDSNVASYLMQMHPEADAGLHPQYDFKGRLNSARLLFSFFTNIVQ